MVKRPAPPFCTPPPPPRELGGAGGAAWGGGAERMARGGVQTRGRESRSDEEENDEFMAHLTAGVMRRKNRAVPLGIWRGGIRDSRGPRERTRRLMVCCCTGKVALGYAVVASCERANERSRTPPDKGRFFPPQ